MRKYMILATIAVLALTACAKIETGSGGNAQKKDVPIGFTNYTPRPLSKVGDTYISGTSLVTDKQFAVYAWLTAYDSFLPVNPGVPGFMDPAVVTWKNDTGTGSTNTYTPTRYWPAGDTPANLSFTAYYPYGGAGITAPTFATGVGTYEFEAQDASADMIDFCVADVVNDQVYGSTNKFATTNNDNHKGTVDFSFHHQLTKVQFCFKTTETDASTEVKLVEAQLKNVYTKGTLTATFAQHTEDTDNDTTTPEVTVTGVNKVGTTSTNWSDQSFSSPKITYDLTLNNSNPTVTSNEIKLETSVNTIHQNDIFLMVPQEMVEPTFNTDTGALTNTPQYLEVTWKVITNGVATTNTRKLYLYDCLDNSTSPTRIDWEKNNNVIYTVTIGPSPIYFTGTVSNWEAEQNGYFNVQ